MEDVIIVGAGLSGLACAYHLEQAGLSPVILDAADRIGGRIATDEVGGFLLDRGFQIWLTSYPEGKALLDPWALDLRPFTPGALCWTGPSTGFARLSDPRRDPAHLLTALLSPAIPPLDKLRTARLLFPLLTGTPDALLPPDPTTAPTLPPHADRRRLSTLDLLKSSGLSDRALRTFFRPFLAGVLLEDRLDTLAGFAMYTLRMFATGDAVLPAGGMAAIPRQLASRLTRTRIELNSPVTAVEPGEVLLADGRRLTARAVVVAAADPAARTLLHLPPCPAPPKSTACLYFAAPEPPPSAREPILHLDGTGTGPINTVVFPSVVQPTYAPQGQTLVSLSTVGLPRMPDDALRTAALAQIRTWFGPQVGGWRHLRTYRIPHALPAADPASRPIWKLSARITPGLYRAGDALDSPSSQGALASGRRAADAILADLR